MRWTLIAAVGFQILLVSQAHATTIITFWTPALVTIGADSREGNADKSYPVCKITVSDNTFWAWSGVSKDSATGFNLDEIISSGMASVGSLNWRIRNLETIIVSKLVPVINHVRVTAPLWEEGEGIVQAVFGDFENGVSHVHVIEFIPRTNGANLSIQIRRRNCPDDDCGVATYFSLGQHKIIDDKVSRDPTIWLKFSVPEAIRYFIETEIVALPDHVGPPIAIAEITQHGARWISKGECAE